jgi:hypothetical protein
LLTVFAPVHCDLALIGGPRDGAVTDSLYQEVDLATGLVRKEWHSLDHEGLAASYSSPVGSSTTWPFDYFHINSIDMLPNGHTLLSARNTWALYELDTHTGQIVSTVGGKRSSIKLEHGTETAYQHDAAVLPNGQISIFDNGAVPNVHPESRGIVVAIDTSIHAERLVAVYAHPKPLLSASQGNMQVLPNGDVFIGWGAAPWLSEFSKAGTLLFDAHLPPDDESYRGYRFQWTGQPPSQPAIAAEQANGKLTVYASWNGATDVASWRLLAGPIPRKLSPITTTVRTGFETSLQAPAEERYVAVQAMDASGHVLGASHPIASTPASAQMPKGGHGSGVTLPGA